MKDQLQNKINTLWENYYSNISYSDFVDKLYSDNKLDESMLEKKVDEMLVIEQRRG